MSADKLVDECNSLMATAVVATSQVKTISLDNRAEEHDETFEDTHKEPIDTSLPIIAVKEPQPEEHEGRGKDFIVANNIEPMERAMVLYQPLAPVIQEEQEQVDAHEAKVEGFAGLNDPIKMTENPQ